MSLYSQIIYKSTGLQVYYCGGLPLPIDWMKNTIGDCAVFTFSTDGLGGIWGPMTDMPDGGRNHAWTCVDDEKMYVFGGRNNLSWEVAETLVYEPATDKWTITAEVPIRPSLLRTLNVNCRVVFVEVQL